MRDNASKLLTKKDRLNKLAVERAGLIKQIPAPATDEEARLQADLQKRRQALAEAQQATATDKQKLQRIEDLRTRIAAFKAQMATFASELHETLTTSASPPTTETHITLRSRTIPIRHSLADKPP